MLRTFLFIFLSCAFTVAVATDQRAQTQQEIARATKDIIELKKQLSKIQKEKSAAEQALYAEVMKSRCLDMTVTACRMAAHQTMTAMTAA